MKRIYLIALMIISAAITIYAVVFWQPSDDIRVENKIDNEIDSSLSSKVKDDNVEEKIVIENINSEDESSIDNIPVVLETDIFKVEKSEIKKLLTKDEKNRIDIIIKKMSAVDLNNLKEKFNNENKSERFKEGFSLIRTRTSDSEYEEIKEILSDYIDFDVLEIQV